MRFEVIINNTQRSIRGVQRLRGNLLVWFTDRSNMDAGVGAEVTGPRFRFFDFLGKTPSIFHIEMYAIETPKMSRTSHSGCKELCSIT